MDAAVIYFPQSILYRNIRFICRRLQQTGGTQDSALPNDSIEHQQPPHPHYHHHPHQQCHHDNHDNEDDKDEDDDDHYDQMDDSDDNNASAYASRALRCFTARAAASAHDGSRLRTANWAPHAAGTPDKHLLYQASTNGSATSVTDELSFTGRHHISSTSKITTTVDKSKRINLTKLNKI